MMGGSGAAHPDAKKLADELKSLMNVKNIELKEIVTNTSYQTLYGE